MLQSPFTFEGHFTDKEYQKLGLLALRWSHTEHIIGNCLKVMLRLSDEEAVAVVFGISMTQRLDLIRKLAKAKPMSLAATAAFREFDFAWTRIQCVRNTVIHAIIDQSGPDPIFHLRSGGRNIAKADVFSIEGLTNYAGHAARALRYGLGQKGVVGERHALPLRPTVPSFLDQWFPQPKARPRTTKKVAKAGVPKA